MTYSHCVRFCFSSLPSYCPFFGGIIFGQTHVLLSLFSKASSFASHVFLTVNIFNRFQNLLREHVVVTLFLTMLVGAGGNAGNQSAIKVRV